MKMLIIIIIIIIINKMLFELFEDKFENEEEFEEFIFNKINSLTKNGEVVGWSG